MILCLVALSALVILADVVLSLLAVAPPIVGVGVGLLTYRTDENAWMIAACVSALCLPSSIWIVRFPPTPERLGPWKAPAITVTLALALALFAVFQFANSVTGPSAIGCLAAAITQGVCVLISRRIAHRPWVPTQASPGSPRHRQSVLSRYVHLPPTVRFWVRGKMRWDPLFETLHRHVPQSGTLLDVGCGYALPAVWLACLHPHLRILAFDSHPRRLGIARYALAQRALVFQADARDWVALFDAHDETSRGLDVVLCIDVLHHLDEPKRLLQSLAARMQKDATLLLRTTIRGRGEQHAHHIERWMVRMRGQRTVRFYEQPEVEDLLVDCGFRLDCVERDEVRTETLFVARRS